MTEEGGQLCPSCSEPLPDEARFCGHCGRRIAPAVHSDDDWIGTLVASRYRVIKRLGEGGMGVVFEVEQTRLGKRAAMKVLSAQLAGEPRVQRQFQREAEAAAQLEHPGIAQVIDFGMDRGRPYLVMELVRGVNLGDVLDRDGALTPVRAAAILVGIAAPVDEAHARGIVHRDLKPENVLLTRDRSGRDLIKVLDFGLAKLAGKDSPEDSGEGFVAGTPAYMAPEHIQGKPTDARSDVYALACLAYRMIVGVPPFSAPSPLEVITKHLGERPVPPSERAPGRIGKALDAVVLEGLAKDPAARPASAGALARAFADAVGFDAWSGGPGVAGPVPADADYPHRRGELALDDGLTREDVDQFDAWLERRKTWRERVVPMVLLAAIGGGVWWWASRPEPPRAAEVEPNESVDEATLVIPGAVRGDRSTERRDVDLLKVGGPRTEVVQVTVQPAKKDDLAVALLAPDGRVIAEVDEGGGGVVEELPAIRTGGLADAPIVRIQAGLGGGPGGAWTATITAGPATPGVELEPDDGSIAVGEAIQGSSYRRGDVDRYRVRGAGGARVVLEGAKLQLRVRGGAPAASPVTATLADGDTIEVVRGFDAPAGAIPYVLRVER